VVPGPDTNRHPRGDGYRDTDANANSNSNVNASPNRYAVRDIHHVGKRSTIVGIVG
jgi:hypothetical protein